MDSISVCSRDGNYFLCEDIGGRIAKTPLRRGRYKGTLEINDHHPTNTAWMNSSTYQYTLHPEYCNVAWIPKASGSYRLTFYDKFAVTERFYDKAIVSMEGIQRVVLTERWVWFENMFIANLSDNKFKHIYPFAMYDLYRELLEG